MLFISDAHYYVPVTLCRSLGSIHLFKITGKLLSNHVKLNKHISRTIIEIGWKEVNVTLNGNKENLPTSLVVSLRDKYKVRRIIKWEPLFFCIVLKQGMIWFPLVTNDSSEEV